MPTLEASKIDVRRLQKARNLRQVDWEEISSFEESVLKGIADLDSKKQGDLLSSAIARFVGNKGDREEEASVSLLAFQQAVASTLQQELGQRFLDISDPLAAQILKAVGRNIRWQYIGRLYADILFDKILRKR